MGFPWRLNKLLYLIIVTLNYNRNTMGFNLKLIRHNLKFTGRFAILEIEYNEMKNVEWSKWR